MGDPDHLYKGVSRCQNTAMISNPTLARRPARMRQWQSLRVWISWESINPNDTRQKPNPKQDSVKRKLIFLKIMNYKKLFSVDAHFQIQTTGVRKMQLPLDFEYSVYLEIVKYRYLIF